MQSVSYFLAIRLHRMSFLGRGVLPQYIVKSGDYPKILKEKGYSSPIRK